MRVCQILLSSWEMKCCMVRYDFSAQCFLSREDIGQAHWCMPIYCHISIPRGGESLFPSNKSMISITFWKLNEADILKLKRLNQSRLRIKHCLLYLCRLFWPFFGWCFESPLPSVKRCFLHGYKLYSRWSQGQRMISHIWDKENAVRYALVADSLLRFALNVLVQLFFYTSFLVNINERVVRSSFGTERGFNTELNMPIFFDSEEQSCSLLYVWTYHCAFGSFELGWILGMFKQFRLCST